MQFGLMAVFLPGVINSAASHIYVPKKYRDFYGTNWIVNTFAGLLIYWILCLVFPAKETLIPAGIAVLDGQLPDGDVEKEAVQVEFDSDVVSKKE